MHQVLHLLVLHHQYHTSTCWPVRSFSSRIHRNIYWSISNAHVSAANVDKLALSAAIFFQWDLAIIYISSTFGCRGNDVVRVLFWAAAQENSAEPAANVSSKS